MLYDNLSGTSTNFLMATEESQPAPTRRQQAIGVSLVVSVAIIWVVAAQLIQYIFDDGSSDYDKPYTLSYICVSMFFVFLLGFCKPSWRSIVNQPSATYSNLNEENPTETDIGTKTVSSTSLLSLKQHIQLAAVLAPLFFFCNYAYNLGLAYTSVASSSIIATLTSLFTLILGALTGVERFSGTKCLAAFLSVIGAIVIILADEGSRDKSEENPLLGDTVSVISAFMYASYTTVLKSQAPTEGSVNVAMLLSFIGLIVALAAWPGIIILNWTGVEVFVLPSGRTALLLVLNALIGTVLSDFLWALSVILTTPLMTTLSLSLTVPLSIISDLMLKRKSFTIEYFVGASLVFLGFILVNIAVSVNRNSQSSS